MGFLENLTNDAFANKMADHYHTHIGAAEFKSIRDEAKSGANPQTPPWGAQPYIQRGMRGGLNKLTAPVIDAIRVGGFMASPKGLLFIAKQTGLQRSNPLGEFGVNPIHISRKYNPLSMIDQVLRGPLGTHLDRHGGGTTNLEETNYGPRIKKLNLGKSNRLVDIASQLDVGYHRELDLISSEVSTLNYVESLEQKKTSRNNASNKARPKGPIVIAAMSGLGGPNSFFGIGRTDHRAYLRNLPKHIATYYKPSRDALPVGDPGPDSYTGLKGTEGDYKGLVEPDNFSPFKKKDLAGSSDNPLAKYQTLSYGGIVRAGKDTSTTTPIKSFKDGTRYPSSSYSTYGLIDYGNVTAKNNVDKYGEYIEKAGDMVENEQESDFVTFKLEGKVAGKQKTLKFRSYGLGSITDNTSFSWSEVTYAGRTMAQHKFDKVSRDVSHDLMIVAFSPRELKQNFNRLNELYQLASPSVGADDGLATAPFCKFTLGDLYFEQNVIIDKITFTVDESTTWDIGNRTADDITTINKQLPMMIKLNLGYKLITNASDGFFTNSSNYWHPIS